MDLGIRSKAYNTEVLIYYIDKLEDVDAFVALCISLPLPRENRTIMIYRKGRKDDVNRDSIFLPFRKGEYMGLRLKAPMIYSLSEDLSACVQCKIV
jgi:hypothetical protein